MQSEAIFCLADKFGNYAHRNHGLEMFSILALSWLYLI